MGSNGEDLLDAAARSAEVIVHCAGSARGDEQKTRALVAAARDAWHIVLISVVGANQSPQASAIAGAPVMRMDTGDSRACSWQALRG